MYIDSLNIVMEDIYPCSPSGYAPVINLLQAKWPEGFYSAVHCIIIIIIIAGKQRARMPPACYMLKE